MKTTFWSLTLVIVMLASVAQAEVHTISWTNATLNEDGTSFDASMEQEEIRLEVLLDAEITPSVFISPGVATQLDIDLQVGTNQIIAKTVPKTGDTSQPSGILTIIVSPTLIPIPLAPSNLRDN